MALIIRGEMPKGCEVNDENHKIKSCPLKNSCEAYLKRYQVDRDIIDYYPEDCPIIGEIPDEHGDLIERSAVIDIILTNPLMQSDTVKVCSLVHRVKNAPTIVEASR